MLLSLGTLLTTSGLFFPITSSLLFSLVPVCRLSLPLHRRGGLCGTSLRHIVRPVLQCPSPPLRYLAWVLSSPSYDPFITASPFSLSHAGLISLWHIVRLASRLSHLPSSPSPLPTYFLSCFNLHRLLTRCPGKS